MFGNRKRIERMEEEIASLSATLQSVDYDWKNAIKFERKRTFEEIENIRKELSETQKAMSEIKTIRGMTTVPEAPVSISDVMDEWLNGKEDGSENE